MGGSSSTPKNESKTVDSNGQVNNNIVIQEAEDTHSSMILSEQLLFATWILIGLEVLKISIALFSAYRRQMKKKYQAAHA